jgi:hypothetical protein
MFRQSLVTVSRSSFVARRNFVSSAAARTLPSVKQPHTIDKPGKDDTNPQTENMEKAREEKKSTHQQSKGGKPKKGPNAGIGLQVSVRHAIID